MKRQECDKHNFPRALRCWALLRAETAIRQQVHRLTAQDPDKKTVSRRKLLSRETAKNAAPIFFIGGARMKEHDDDEAEEA